MNLKKLSGHQKRIHYIFTAFRNETSISLSSQSTGDHVCLHGSWKFIQGVRQPHLSPVVGLWP